MVVIVIPFILFGSNSGVLGGRAICVRSDI
jgi:hypothetical protein